MTNTKLSELFAEHMAAQPALRPDPVLIAIAEWQEPEPDPRPLAEQFADHINQTHPIDPIMREIASQE